MKLLFVCKYNRFRSKVAEAIFNRLSDKLSKKSEVKSAGISLDLMRPYAAKSVKEILKEKGYEIENEKARQINELDLRWADKIIVAADNVSHYLFLNDKTEFWQVEDADERDGEKIKKIIGEIEARVKEMIMRLERD